MNTLSKFSQSEPLTRNAGIGVVITSLLVWLRTMGYIDWTEEQFAVTEEMVMILANALVWIALIIQPRLNKEVTPAVSPTTKDGEKLIPASAIGELVNYELGIMQNAAIVVKEPIVSAIKELVNDELRAAAAANKPQGETAISEKSVRE